MPKLLADVLKLRPADAGDLLARAGRWWLTELLAMFPPRLAAWLTGRDRKALIIALDDACVRLRLEADGAVLAAAEIDRAAYAPAAIDDFLAARRLRRADVDIGLRLPAGQYFHRSFVVPVEAGRALDKVALQDLTRRTPFRLGEVYHDFVASRSAGKLVVTQWVARRAAADEVMHILELPPGSVGFLDAAAGEGPAPAPYIRMLRDRAAGRSWAATAGLALLVAGAVLTASSIALRLWQQQALLDEAGARLAEVRPKAQQVRAMVDRLERTQARIYRLHVHKRDGVRLLDAWEETTRILPDHTWLTELKLTEAADKQPQQVVMIGYSSAAAGLVALVDASPAFVDASLVSPIARDNSQDRERFSIQARVRPPQPSKDVP
jgi:general secretion pathway protein L